MVRVMIDLHAAGPVRPTPFVSEDGMRAVAWVEIGDRSEASVFGTPDELRGLAAAASAAADEAEEMLRIAEQLTAAGLAERGVG